MNFEREIEKKLIAKLEAYQYVIDNSVSVKEFGSITGIEDVLRPVITTEVRQRVNINGGLWNTDIVLDVLTPLSSDTGGVKADALYEVIADCIASLKHDPSHLSSTEDPVEYEVDGLINTEESGRPEFGAIRLASLSAKLFISWTYQP